MSPVSKGKRLPRRVRGYSLARASCRGTVYEKLHQEGYSAGWADAKADTLQEEANALETMGKVIFKQRSSK